MRIIAKNLVQNYEGLHAVNDISLEIPEGKIFGIIGKNLTYMRFAPWDWLMSPLWRIYHFAWRKWNGYV